MKHSLKGGTALGGSRSEVANRQNPLGVGAGTGAARTFTADVVDNGDKYTNDASTDLRGPLLVNQGTLRSRHIVVDPGTLQNIGDADPLRVNGPFESNADINTIGKVSEVKNPQRRRRYGR